jgi:hypothetical protein
MWKAALVGLLVAGCASEGDDDLDQPIDGPAATISFTLRWPHARSSSTCDYGPPDCSGTCGAGSCSCVNNRFPNPDVEIHPVVECCTATKTLLASKLSSVVAAYARCEVEQVTASVYTIHCDPDGEIPTYLSQGDERILQSGTLYTATGDFPCSWSPPW